MTPSSAQPLAPPIDLCSDRELGYERNRMCFEAGAGLSLDETYRLAHLPLVAPHHPHVIPAREGTYYVMGCHPQVFSLVLPIPDEALLRSAAYQELNAELRAAPFAARSPGMSWSGARQSCTPQFAVRSPLGTSRRLFSMKTVAVTWRS
jgi:hypothetical protein